MKDSTYLFDTHALYFWIFKTDVSREFLEFFDERNDLGRLLISAVNFWELALLSENGRLEITDISKLKNQMIDHAKITIVNPTADEMITSVKLQKIHKDPFDRLLIAQSQSRGASFVTRDKMIKKYPVKTFWI